MKTLKREIANRIYFVVGWGDGYDSKVVKGDKLVDYLSKLILGTEPGADEIQELISDLNDEENWCHFNGDMQFGKFRQDIGEIGHVEIWRITNTP